jgi:hypothetical protein
VLFLLLHCSNSLLSDLDSRTVIRNPALSIPQKPMFQHATKAHAVSVLIYKSLGVAAIRQRILEVTSRHLLSGTSWQGSPIETTAPFQVTEAI